MKWEIFLRHNDEVLIIVLLIFMKCESSSILCPRKDVLLNKMKHQYLFCFFNLAVNSCFLISNLHKYHILLNITQKRLFKYQTWLIFSWHCKSCNVFTIYETLFQNVINIYQWFTNIKLKHLEKIGSAWFYQKK